MAKGKTTKKGNPKGKVSKQKRNIRIWQTQQPFEQDAKRPAGQYCGASAPSLMKKYISLAWQVLTLNYWPR